MTKTEKPETYPCRECQAGVVRPRYITYFTWLNEELITVPSFPAWICDLCGKREYDQRAVSWLAMLLKPDTGHSSERKKKSQRAHRPEDFAAPTAKQ